MLILSGVERFPFSFDDGGANLYGGLSLTQLFEGVEVFVNTGAAPRTVFAGKAIEQALVALAAVAMAVAGLLVKRLLDFCGDRVRVLHDRVGKKIGIHRRGKFSLRGLRMIRGHRLVGRRLRRIRVLGRLRSGPLRNENQPQRKTEKRHGTQESTNSI